ncbi:glycosyltransferase family 1 protein [Ramaria rubella]|nr:glycosyltransferase family 1 protein [Ramaria rubella]
MRLLRSLLTTIALICNVVRSTEHPEVRERPYIAFVTIPMKGHATPVHALAQELSDRGYDTDFITMDTPGLTDEFARATGPHYVSLFPFDHACPPETLHLTYLVANGLGVGRETIAREFNPARILSIWRCPLTYYEDFLPAITHRFIERRPDLVVADYFTLGAIDAAFNLSIPLVVNSPTIYSTESFNLPTGWSPYHSWGAKDLSAEGTFSSLRRWLNHLQRRYFHAINAENLVIQWHQEMRVMYGDSAFKNFPPHSSVPNLVNIFFGLEYAQPVPPHHTLVGPILSRDAEAQAIGALDHHGERDSQRDCPEIVWLDDLVKEDPQVHVILINFGTTGALRPRQLWTMLAGFADLHGNINITNFRVLWRLSDQHFQNALGSEDTPSIPPYVRFFPWLCSQPATLRHPAVHLFVSHAGINSAQEGILAGVPVLAMPGFSDQHAMGMRIIDSGVGLSLHAERFTSHEFANAISQILDPHANFSTVAQELRNILILNPAGLGRKHGADVIEDVLRRGYKHLVPLEALREPGWGKAGLDVLVIDVVVILGMLWILKAVGRKAWKTLRGVIRQRVPQRLKRD